SDDFAAVSAAFKRMKNILNQSEKSGDLGEATHTAGVAVHPAQTALATAAEAARIRVTELLGGSDYVASLETIATLRPHVDKFFEEVMVLDPDPTVRLPRLVLLAAI